MMNRKLIFIIILIQVMVFGRLAAKDLLLTANECFFSPIGNLRCVVDDSRKAEATLYNSHKADRYMGYVTNWVAKGDTIIWGLKDVQAGRLIIKPQLVVPVEQYGSTIDVMVGQDVKTITLSSDRSISISFDVVETKSLSVKLILKTIKEPTQSIAHVEGCLVSGDALAQASVWLRRWRPAAVHCKWGSSENPQNVTLCILENTIITTGIPMYQPITTPFGYTGSTWNPGKQIFGGYNFSLWSYGQNEVEPPVEQLSHLIAVGQNLTFGTYGHEGTGVKPRGKNPFEDFSSTTQTIAVMKQPGIPYDTYYSYYLNPETEEWVLYGCGRKFNKKRTISYLTTGAFVEEPGRPEVNRNGHQMREVQYRGWMMDEDKKWYCIDKMKGNFKGTELSYKNWGVKENKFFMQMGGLMDTDYDKGELTLPTQPSVDDRPSYLKGNALVKFGQLPADIGTSTVKVEKGGKAGITIDLKRVGENAKGELFWGTREGLTLEDRWENKTSFDPELGANRLMIEGLSARTKIYFRVKITNDEGITWAWDTEKFITLKH